MRRILLGAFPDGGHGLRISRSGYDVASNPVDDRQLLFNSDWIETLPVHVAGSVTVAGTGSADVSFPALGYAPFAIFAVSVGSGQFDFYNGLDDRYLYWSDVKAFQNIRIGNGSIHFQQNAMSTATFLYSIYRRRAF